MSTDSRKDSISRRSTLSKRPVMAVVHSAQVRLAAGDRCVESEGVMRLRATSGYLHHKLVSVPSPCGDPSPRPGVIQLPQVTPPSERVGWLGQPGPDRSRLDGSPIIHAKAHHERTSRRRSSGSRRPGKPGCSEPGISAKTNRLPVTDNKPDASSTRHPGLLTLYGSMCRTGSSPLDSGLVSRPDLVFCDGMHRRCVVVPAMNVSSS